MDAGGNVIALTEAKARKVARENNKVPLLRQSTSSDAATLEDCRSVMQLSPENDQRVRSLLEEIISGELIPPENIRKKGTFVDATDISAEAFQSISNEDPIHTNIAYLDSQMRAIADVCGEAMARKIASGIIPALHSAFEYGRFIQAIDPE